MAFEVAIGRRPGLLLIVAKYNTSGFFLTTFPSTACYRGIQKLEFSRFFSEFFSFNLSFLQSLFSKKSKIREEGIQKSEFLGDFGLSYAQNLSFFEKP